MRVSVQAVETDFVSVDTRIMTRVLDQIWVEELAALYEDRIVEIDPVLLMKDPDGILWLADGFHRMAAVAMCGHSGIMAEVRDGTFEKAVLLACKANTRGLRRNLKDQFESVTRTLRHPEAKDWSVKDVAKYCGTTIQFVQDVQAGRMPSAMRPKSVHVVTGRVSIPTSRKSLYEKVDSALRSNPRSTNTDIADSVGCDRGVVARRRVTLGLEVPKDDPPKSERPKKFDPPKSERSKSIEQKKALAVKILQDQPDVKLKDVSEASGLAPSTISGIRRDMRLSIPTGEIPSAPTPRNRPDARDSAIVERVRPQSDRLSAPSGETKQTGS